MKKRERWTVGILVFCLLLGIYLLVFSGVGVTDDEQLFSVLSGSLASGRGNNILPLYGNDRLRGESGNLEPLHIILNIPLYKLAEAAGWGRAQAQHLPAGIYIALSAALLAGLALRRGYARSTAVSLALAFGLGTIAFPYARSNFREPLAMACLTGAAVLLDLLRISSKSFFRYLSTLFGMFIFIGLAALTKITCGVCLPFFLAAAFLNLKKGAGRPTRQVMALFALSLLIGLLLLWGIFGLLPVETLRRFSPDFVTSMVITLSRLPHGYFWQALAGMLVSPGKGLLVYSPVVILALIPKHWLRQAQPTALHTDSLQQAQASQDKLIAFGSLTGLMVLQALIYDQDWWGITWSTRALLPALPLIMLAALPALDAGLRSARKPIRALNWALLAAGALIQAGRVWISDPAYANWVVQATGQNLHEAQQWHLRLLPLWRHWQLALQGVQTDIAWLHLRGAGQHYAPLLVGAIALVICACAYFLFREKPTRPSHLFLVGLCTLSLLPASLAVARFDSRYHAENENYRAACEWIAANTDDDSLLLVDAYLKPLWWFAFNFGCGERTWLGLPYEHYKPLSGALYYPRLIELSAWLKEQQGQGVGVYLLEADSPEPLDYHGEFEKYDLNFKQQNSYTEPPHDGLNIYQLW